MRIVLKRVYDDTGGARGYRVLVDRLWPRGISKEKLRMDEWLRDLAPTTELRTWFHHEPSRWKSFRLRYLQELRSRRDDLNRLRAIATKKLLVLLYSAKDEEHNQAVVIREALLKK